MIPITRQPGFAPAVTIVDGLVYVAYGVQPDALLLEVFTSAGALVKSVSLPGGFYDSFPAFSGRWLAYKRNTDWLTQALNVLDGQAWTFGEAAGNFPIAVNDAVGLVAWQQGARYAVQFGELLDGTSRAVAQTGAPDGLSALGADGVVTLRKDVRLSVPGIFWPVRAGDLVVGEWVTAPYGLGVQLEGDELRVAGSGQDCPTPSCATDGQTYALVTGGPQGVRIWIGSRADLQALPRAADIPAPAAGPVTFAFTHPVGVYPFFAAGSGLPDLFTLGDYSEDPAPPLWPLADRGLFAHDGQIDWTVPVAQLRAWDLCLIECYLVQGESLAQSVARWTRQAQALLAQWPGDCGLIPMLYCQGGAPPNELWPVTAVLDGLRRLSPIVNLSPRIKVLAPFAYNRANGVTAHPEFQQALGAMVAEATRVGPATLTPIGAVDPPKPPPPVPPIPPAPPVPPPAPPIPATRFPAARSYGAHMSVYLKLNGKYVGVDPSKPDVVYHDRAAGGAWEEVELTPRDGGQFLVRFVAADRALSIQPDGSLQTRPSGTDGPYELLRATSQPEGLDILYREDGGVVLGVPLSIEAIQ